MLLLGISIFFGLILFAIVLLFCVNFIANKYLKGDFFSSKDDDDDESIIDETFIDVGNEDEVANKFGDSKAMQTKTKEDLYNKYGKTLKVKTIGGMSSVERLREAASQYNQYSDKEAALLIQKQHGCFIENVLLKFSLEYIIEQKCVLGVFHSLDNINKNGDELPQYISLHTKILPKKRFHNKTKWRSVGDTQTVILEITFTLAPIQLEDSSPEQLSIRVYGKNSGLLAKQKCYGECFVRLKELLNDSPKKHHYSKYILPKANRKLDATVQILSSDSELEFS